MIEKVIFIFFGILLVELIIELVISIIKEEKIS